MKTQLEKSNGLLEALITKEYIDIVNKQLQHLLISTLECLRVESEKYLKSNVMND